jgi:hypothetical protein
MAHSCDSAPPARRYGGVDSASCTLTLWLVLVQFAIAHEFASRPSPGKDPEQRIAPCPECKEEYSLEADGSAYCVNCEKEFVIPDSDG